MESVLACGHCYMNNMVGTVCVNMQLSRAWTCILNFSGLVPSLSLSTFLSQEALFHNV